MARTARSIGMILLAVYLILVGLAQLTGAVIPYSHVILGLLALISGILLLLGR